MWWSLIRASKMLSHLSCDHRSLCLFVHSSGTPSVSWMPRLTFINTGYLSRPQSAKCVIPSDILQRCVWSCAFSCLSACQSPSLRWMASCIHGWGQGLSIQGASILWVIWVFPSMVVPLKHSKMIISLVGKPMVVGHHHFRKPPYEGIHLQRNLFVGGENFSGRCWHFLSSRCLQATLRYLD